MGSLFQLRDCWHHSFPEEEFSPSCFAAGDLDNQNDGNKIAIGSFQGVFRIFQPSSALASSSDGISPADLLYEERLGETILQIACGPFEPPTSGVGRNLLAILFSDKLRLLSVERCGGEGEKEKKDEEEGGHPETQPQEANPQEANSDHEDVSAVYYRCTPIYTLEFDQPTYNFTTGRFGGVEYDRICVQTMNGRWSIVDYHTILCSCSLPASQFLVPGCLTYCGLRDSFLTCNTSYFLLCYSFAGLTSAADADSSPASASSSERLSPVWGFNLGEEAVGIEVCRLSRGLESGDADIVVLCSYSLRIFSLEGVCRYLRPFSNEASCLAAYALSSSLDNVLVGAWDGSVGIFSGIVLEWSAKLTFGGAPMALQVGTFCGVKGMLLLATVEGVLMVGYLGTDPASRKPPPVLQSKAMDYAEMRDELRQVRRQIKSIQAGKKTPFEAMESTTELASLPMKGAAAAEKSDLDPKSLDGFSKGSATAQKGNDSASPITFSFETPSSNPNDGDGAFLLSLLLSFPKGEEVIESEGQVRLWVKTTPPIMVEPSYLDIEHIERGTTTQIPLSISVDKTSPVIPSSLELVVMGVFQNRVSCTASTTLPFSLVCRVVPPFRQTDLTLQINADRAPAPSLFDLFLDLLPSECMRENLMSVELVNGAGATLLVSKNAARFKLQGSSLEGLGLLSSELIRRLRLHYAQKDGAPLNFGTPDEPPLEKFFEAVNAHTGARNDFSNAMEALNQAANFMRNVQKRLLAGFRDRTPTEMSALTLLFAESRSSLQEATEKVCLAKLHQKQAAAVLNCCCQLMWIWLGLQNPDFFSQNKEISETLRSLLTCEVLDDDGVKWEEETEAALTHMLGIAPTQTFQPMLKAGVNNTNLKKRLSAVFDGVAKRTLGKRI